VRDLHKLETFAGDGVFHVVVESPRGAVVKLKYSPELKAMSISRPLVLGVTYPCDWGFVPSTESPDRDPLDAAIWWDVTTYPGVVIPCRALAVVRVEQNGERVIIRVIDDGPGIPSQDMPNLFEPFYRVDRSRSKKTGGYGLGLSIAKRIVEAHGGTIGAANNAHRGVAFTVTLPKPA
jgi:hypothetical protein